MNARTVWSFIAGDSKYAPLAGALGAIVALVLTRWVPASGPVTGAVYVAIIAGGLIAAVFERT